MRTRMLEAAEALLDDAPDGDVSTRAVCEAVGVGAPVLYRLFGDKAGLLGAVVDHGFDRYLAGKRAARPSDDPVEDLRSGWDTHVAFALEHRAVYRLMFSPAFASVPSAAGEALLLLREVLERCAAVGRLRIHPDAAAQAIMSANIGVALSLVSQPDVYADPDLSTRVRDAVHREILFLDAPAAASADAAATALQLSAQLKRPSDAVFTAGERALLLEWLDRVAQSHELKALPAVPARREAAPLGPEAADATKQGGRGSRRKSAIASDEKRQPYGGGQDVAMREKRR